MDYFLKTIEIYYLGSSPGFDMTAREVAGGR
jgi:hypothetical protein